MADYIVTSGELTTVADAIREKNGTSSNLSWPDGFVSGISSGGGGSSDFSTAEVTFSGTFLGEISWNNCPTLINNMLAGSLYIDSLPTTIIVPLYKGKCVWQHGTSGLTLSGNIEPYYDGMLITGDCAIVIDR